MSKVEDFLSAAEEQEIVAAIRTAEKHTSGEIRVHLEAHTDKVHYDRALEVFQGLKMYATEQRNGVLIYVAVVDKTFVIYGDRGIDEVVPVDFWESTRNAMLAKFKQGKFTQGIIDGILKAGEELKAHFPWQEGDVDELSNEISKG